MTLRLEDKEKIVAAVSETASSAFSAVVADYHGLTVAQMTKLRTAARAQGVWVQIVRNTLAKRAFKGTGFELLNDALVGPKIIGMSTSEDDMGAAARLFKEFARENPKLEIVTAAFDGKLYAANEIDKIANLPNLHGALTMLASVLQAPVSKFARLLTAVKEKQESAA